MGLTAPYRCPGLVGEVDVVFKSYCIAVELVAVVDHFREAGELGRGVDAYGLGFFVYNGSFHRAVPVLDIAGVSGESGLDGDGEVSAGGQQ